MYLAVTNSKCQVNNMACGASGPQAQQLGAGLRSTTSSGLAAETLC